MVTLLPIDQIIKTARALGISFGPGDPKSRLAYLTKLHLLPQTIRRKVAGQIVGCYPESVISTLKKINQLRTEGLTYSQIRFRLPESQELTPTALPPIFPPPSTPPRRPFLPASNSFSFLLIGLILGYLLASSGHPSPTDTSPAVNLPREPLTVSSPPSADSGPIYLLALPNQNFYKIGKTDINNLINN